MADYVLEGPKWGTGGQGTSGGVVTWAADASVPSGFTSIISQAFSDWAKWANVQFQMVASTAAAQIDVTFGAIDGLDNVLGQTSYYTAGNTFTGATIEFDTGEKWVPSTTNAVSADGIDFFAVALHEIGHSIGMDHYNAAPAVMNATIDRSVTDLMQSDIDGAQAIYGKHANLLADTVHDVSGYGGEIYALYHAILGRTPDTLGYENWIANMQNGESLHDVAAQMLGSAEAQGHEGSADNATFVNQLYETAFNRAADAGGLATYTNALNGGESRADVAISLALSAEGQTKIQSALTSGVLAPDVHASDVARLYYGILGRGPDAAGLATYTEAVDQGTSLLTVAQAMVSSTEYLNTHGTPSDSQFVQGLYTGALGRTADAGGSATYTHLLATGTSRAQVAVTIAESQEAHTHLLPVIENGLAVA